MPVFKLTLERTYYEKGFFNVTVEFQRYVTDTDGPIRLLLGSHGSEISGRVSRAANRNGTPRIYGGAALRDWFQSNYRILDTVDIDLGPSIRIGAASPPSSPPSSGPPRNSVVSADELGQWRRQLIRILDALDGQPQQDHEGFNARITRLSRAGRVPRGIAAFMKTVAELRNDAEYGNKLPTPAQSDAVNGVWAAIREWAKSSGVFADRS